MKYNCKWCNKEFELNTNQINTLNKQPNKPIFCSRQCSGKYYAKKSHEGKTPEQEQARRDKISKSLLDREIKLNDKVKAQRVKNLNAYWKTMTKKERSERNKALADKVKQTKLERYGSSTYNNEVRRKQTNLEKYGVTNTLRTDTAINNAKQINIEKYGTEYFFSNRKAFEQVSLNKYNVSHPMQHKQVKLKLNKTKLERYGDEKYNNTKKMKETCLKKYGRTCGFNPQKSKYTKLARYNDENYNNREQAMKTLYERYGEDFYKQQIKYTGSRISKLNKSFAEFTNIQDFEFPIDKFSYDLKKDNVLIELDPIFTHNCLEDGIHHKFGGIEKEYHFNKSKLAKENGFRCIHIFDWDDWNKIKYMLQDKETLYARKLNIKEVDKDICDDFLNKYHIQNTCRGQDIRFGLFDSQGELIQVMTFGKPRYNKKYQYELLRLCTKAEYKVVGGSNKLFTHFLRTYKPESIISYCDFGKFDGTIYNELGFKQLSKISLNKHWVKGHEHITDNLLRQRGYDQLFKANYGKGTSNEELMLENGWLPIYDAGQLTFVWTS